MTHTPTRGSANRARVSLVPLRDAHSSAAVKFSCSGATRASDFVSGHPGCESPSASSSRTKNWACALRSVSPSPLRSRRSRAYPAMFAASSRAHRRFRQAAVDQRRERVEVGSADGLGGGEGAAAGEYR